MLKKTNKFLPRKWAICKWWGSQQKNIEYNYDDDYYDDDWCWASNNKFFSISNVEVVTYCQHNVAIS